MEKKLFQYSSQTIPIVSSSKGTNMAIHTSTYE
jgi:hypothetical protein